MLFCYIKALNINNITKNTRPYPLIKLLKFSLLSMISAENLKNLSKTPNWQ